MTYSLANVKDRTSEEFLEEALLKANGHLKLCHQAITHLEKENENITNMYLAQMELTGKYNEERKELQEAYEGVKEELEEMTDTADKHYRNYRDEINFGQRNQFKAHEEIEALEYELKRAHSYIRMEEED